MNIFVVFGMLLVAVGIVYGIDQLRKKNCK